MIDVENYIVDYERVNELTVHENDDPKEGYGGIYIMGSRGGVKKYLKTWEEIMLRRASVGATKVREFTPEQKHIFNTLLYNRILINVKEHNRETAIKEILEHNE